MTRPASTIVSITPPRYRMMTAAASSDSGIALRLMTPLRQSRRKNAEDEDHEHRADDQRADQVADRHLDERRRPEDRRVDLDARERGTQRLERLLDALRHAERVPPRLLLDDQQQARHVVDDRVTNRRPVAFDHVGDVAERDRRTVAEGDRRHARSCSAVCTPVRWLTAIRWLGRSTNPPASTDTASPCRAGDVVERQPVRPQPLRIARAPGADGHAVPRSRRWPRPARPSAAGGSSTARASRAPSATASST